MSDLARQPLFWKTGSLPAPPRPANRDRLQSGMRLAARYSALALQSHDLQSLLEEACRVAAKGLGADFARVLVYQAADRTLLLQAGVGWRAGSVGRAWCGSEVETAAGLAWHTGECCVSNPVASDSRFSVPGLLAEHGIVRSTNVAIPGTGSVAFGVLTVECSKHGEFAVDAGFFLQLLANSLAGARERLIRQTLDDQKAQRADDDQISVHELQHRIRNDLQGICSSLEREARGINDVRLRAGYDRVGRRVVALAGLYDHLLQSRSSGTVDMGGYLRSLCAKIVAATDLTPRGIALQAEAQPISMALDRAGRLAIAVNELIANAAEHAFPDGRAGTITVRLFARDPDGVVVIVSDDGRGFQGTRPGGAGLSFVKRLVRGAGGVLTRLDAAGTEWQIVLPI